MKKCFIIISGAVALATSATTSSANSVTNNIMSHSEYAIAQKPADAMITKTIKDGALIYLEFYNESTSDPYNEYIDWLIDQPESTIIYANSRFQEIEKQKLNLSATRKAELDNRIVEHYTNILTDSNDEAKIRRHSANIEKWVDSLTDAEAYYVLSVAEKYMLQNINNMSREVTDKDTVRADLDTIFVRIATAKTKAEQDAGYRAIEEYVASLSPESMQYALEYLRELSGMDTDTSSISPQRKEQLKEELIYMSTKKSTIDASGTVADLNAFRAEYEAWMESLTPAEQAYIIEMMTSL